MIGVVELIRVAPFPEEARGDLLEKVTSMSPEQRFGLGMESWALVSQERQNALAEKQQQAALAMAKRGTQYASGDFQRMEGDLFGDFQDQLMGAKATATLGGVREELKEIQTPQPK